MVRRLVRWLWSLTPWGGQGQRAFRVRAADWVREMLDLGQERPHPLVDPIEVQLDRPRRFCLTNREALEFKRRTGIDIWRDGLNPMDLPVDQFMELLAVLCSAEDPGVTAEDLAAHVYGDRAVDAYAGVWLALQRFAPPQPEGAEAEDPTIASALNHWMQSATGRSQPKSSESGNGTISA